MTDKPERMSYTLSPNGRWRRKDSMHKNATKKKVEKLRAYDHITNHKDFVRVLSLEKPMARKVILEYFRPDTTWQSVSLELNIMASEAQRYFKEGMKRIEKELGL